MASIISALTSGAGGISMTGDASGILNLNSNGTNVVAVTSTGATVTGTLAATGSSTFTGTGKFATTIGVGNATPSASGSGITFPASQSASSDANTLDDYEEGTFTPTVLGSTVAGTGTYGAQGGFYTKIGNRVSFNIYIQWTNLVGATGVILFGGLPFASAGTTNNYAAVSVWSDLLTLTASNYLTCYISPNSTTFSPQGGPVGGGGVTSIAIDTSASIMLAGSYSI